MANHSNKSTNSCEVKKLALMFRATSGVIKRGSLAFALSGQFVDGMHGMPGMVAEGGAHQRSPNPATRSPSGGMELVWDATILLGGCLRRASLFRCGSAEVPTARIWVVLEFTGVDRL